MIFKPLTLAFRSNSGFKKLAVQWLNEVLCFVSSSVVADSLVLRNRQLLKPAKRSSNRRNLPRGLWFSEEQKTINK